LAPATAAARYLADPDEIGLTEKEMDFDRFVSG
jgi:hypothetical protein